MDYLGYGICVLQSDQVLLNSSPNLLDEFLILGCRVAVPFSLLTTIWQDILAILLGVSESATVVICVHLHFLVVREVGHLFKHIDPKVIMASWKRLLNCSGCGFCPASVSASSATRY